MGESNKSKTELAVMQKEFAVIRSKLLKFP